MNSPSSSPVRPVIVLEFNELCQGLIDRWMADGSLPNFARLHARSQVWETSADVEGGEALEPWIQWYSVHTGLPYDRHRVFRLTDGKRAEHDDLWRLVHGGGRSVMSFGSMNVRPFAGDGAVYLGDPWSEEGDAHPPTLNRYNRFVADQVREHTRPGGSGVAQAADFAIFAALNGLSPHTVAAIVRQLALERRDSGESWRRVFLMDRLQFDVFRHWYRRRRPTLATFFLNSTAHLQHGYWRHAEPEAFTLRPPADEIARYGGAIRDGYVAMDALVGRFLTLADAAGATLVFQTALSQQPFTKADDEGGQHFHRLRDHRAFLRSLNVEPETVVPVMTHQYLAHYGSTAERDRAVERLAALTIDGRQVFDLKPSGDEPTLYFGAQLRHVVLPDAEIRDTLGAPSRYADVLYPIDGTKSGCHHPSGALWIAAGTPQVHPQPVSILDTLPTLLKLLEVPVPKELPGRPLLERQTS